MICEICQTEFNHKKDMPPWVDRSTHEVILANGDRNHISLTQWKILGILWRRRLKYDSVSAEGILTVLSVHGPDPSTDSLKVHLTKLRKAMSGRAWLRNIPRTGWRLVEGEIQAS